MGKKEYLPQWRALIEASKQVVLDKWDPDGEALGQSIDKLKAALRALGEDE